jgi:hypothetical protein
MSDKIIDIAQSSCCGEQAEDDEAKKKFGEEDKQAAHRLRFRTQRFETEKIISCGHDIRCAFGCPEESVDGKRDFF